MYVSVNAKGEIHAVGISSDPNLTAIYINDSDNPFVGWSDAKICCYKVRVDDGIVTMMTPYVPSNLIEHFDMLGKASAQFKDSKTAYIYDAECVFVTDRTGEITCSCVTDSGRSVPCSYVVGNGKIVVTFEPLEEVAKVSISIL